MARKCASEGGFASSLTRRGSFTFASLAGFGSTPTKSSSTLRTSRYCATVPALRFSVCSATHSATSAAVIVNGEFTAIAEKWGYWSDGAGELVPFCPERAKREFASDAPASRVPQGEHRRGVASP